MLGAGILHQLAADVALDRQVLRIGDELARNDIGPNRTECVVPLVGKPVVIEGLVFAPHSVASGNVVVAGIARNVVERALDRNVLSLAADHNRKLGFPIDVFGARGENDRVAMTDQSMAGALIEEI